jgi:hypothetical protein
MTQKMNTRGLHLQMAADKDRRAEKCMFFMAGLAVWFLFMLGPLGAVYLTSRMGPDALGVIYILWGITVVACLFLTGFQNVMRYSH